MRRFFYDTEFIEEPGFLELISIGVVDEAGEKEFYFANQGADLPRANDWVKENVIAKLPDRDDVLWQPKDCIAEDLLGFLAPSKEDPVELWGYYSAYDHVVLCWLFGRMVDLPPGMPMYTLDIKQYAYYLGNPKLPEVGKGEHNALADAMWNREAWLFLKKKEVLWRGR